MPLNTNQGKAYSLDELLKLGSLGSFGQYNGAVMGALRQVKSLTGKIATLEKQVEQLKTTISESMHEKFLAEINKEKTKKDK